MNFQVSVIIPVFNAERYIEKAVNSALEQPEVMEIIVVDDGSTDESCKIIEKLQNNNPIIKLYHHKNRINKGRSASRNLGIKKASGNFIAFLDADDYYLKNRFTFDKKKFKESKQIDGVYNAIGAHFYGQSSPSELEYLKLTTITKKIEPENLFDNLLSGKNGYFSIDGLTVKRSVFKEVGFFNEDLIVAEDTELIWKMALRHRLLSGIIDKPVAMRGVHKKNVFKNKKLYDIYELKLYESMYLWSYKNNLGLKIIERFLERIWILQFRKNKKIFKYLVYWIKLNKKSPGIIITYLGLKYFPIIRLRKSLFPFLYN